MLTFTRVQEAFPNEPLTLENGKIYHDGVLLLTRWPSEQDLKLYQHYHGDSADELYYQLIFDDIQCRLDARALPFEEVIARSNKRLEQKFGKK